MGRTSVTRVRRAPTASRNPYPPSQSDHDRAIPDQTQRGTKNNSTATSTGLIRRMVTTAGDNFCRALSVAANGWERFWFANGDPTVLGLIRLLVGGMLVYTHLVWGMDLPAFVGSAGWNSPEVLSIVQDGRIVPSFWWYVTDSWLLPVHCVCMVILVAFWLGLATRVTSVLSMVITISYAYRAHMANFGLDQINSILCLYLCIGPSGAVLSIDRWLQVRRARRETRRLGTPFVSPAVKPCLTANLAVRLIQVHFCVIYICAGLSKLQGPAWWSGEAVWLAFANLEYQSMDMTWIAWYPWVSDLMTHTTILWEVSFAALVWVRPLRPAVLGIGFLLHAGIGAAMGMWTFGLIMIFGHVSFWDKSAIYWVTSLLPSAERWLKVSPAEVIAPAGELPSAARPAVLYVDRGVDRRLSCLSYFLRHDFRCMVTDDLKEAQTLREATTPDAVVVLGAELKDEELRVFHDTHCAQDQRSPLFMVLTENQSTRLNGHVRTGNSHVIAGGVSLGTLRREIQAELARAKPR